MRGHLALMLQRAPHHRAHQIAPVIGIGLMIFQRIDGLGRRFRRGAENFVARRLAFERGFGFRNAARARLGAAKPDARLRDLAALQTIGDQRRRHGEVAGAAVEFVETEFGVAGEQRQPHLREQFVFRQRGGHDAGEEILRRDQPLAARALGDDRRIERCRHQAPFRCRVGMGERAAKCAAHADRIMRDVARHKCQQAAERIIDNGFMKCRMAHARADAQNFSVAGNLVEPRDLVDVDQMRRLRQPERHDRHQALPAGQHAAVLRRHLRQNRQRLVERARHMADKRRWLHAAIGLASKGIICIQTIDAVPGLSKGVSPGAKRAAGSPGPMWSIILRYGGGWRNEPRRRWNYCSGRL